jgi:hypothetical protein
MLNIKSFYSFNTRAPSILGASYKNLKLVSIMDFNTVSAFSNVINQHANIYPHLPNGTPDNPEVYTYYLFKNESNQSVVMADVWIDSATIEEQGSQKLVIEIQNINNSDINRVRTILTTMGIPFLSRVE